MVLKEAAKFEVAVAWESGIQEKAEICRRSGEHLERGGIQAILSSGDSALGMVTKRLRIELQKADFLAKRNVDRTMQYVAGIARLLKSHLAIHIQDVEQMDVN